MTRIVRKPARQLSAERLREILHYDPATGIFCFRVRRGGKKPGDTAGYLDSNGYILIQVDGHTAQGQRLAWLYMHGEWPPEEIDHKNMCRSDNRFDNIRAATKSQNGMNRRKRADNTSGFKGVTRRANGGGWFARIKSGDKQKYLGTFRTPDSAGAAYAEAARRLHGEFSRVD